MTTTKEFVSCVYLGSFVCHLTQLMFSASWTGSLPRKSVCLQCKALNCQHDICCLLTPRKVRRRAMTSLWPLSDSALLLTWNSTMLWSSTLSCMPATPGLLTADSSNSWTFHLNYLCSRFIQIEWQNKRAGTGWYSLCLHSLAERRWQMVWPCHQSARQSVSTITAVWRIVSRLRWMRKGEQMKCLKDSLRESLKDLDINLSIWNH